MITHLIKALECSKTLNKALYIEDILPYDMHKEIIRIPFNKIEIDDGYDGTRAYLNKQRQFVTKDYMSKYVVFQELVDAFQDARIASRMQDICNREVDNSFLRMEYIQDTGEFMLAPHCDIYEKVFSLVIYLFDNKDWGTDIYDDNKQLKFRTNVKYNSAILFNKQSNLCHGFEKRYIDGVRKMIEINYVVNWKDREQLVFPETPIKSEVI